MGERDNIKRIYVISGGPGFGKSTIIDILEKKGFYCGEDVARGFTRDQISNGGKILPWTNRTKFSKIILQKRVKQYENAPNGEICFFDRGIPDIIGYFIKDGLEVPNEYYAAAKGHRYQKMVFLTPPWQKTFKQDSERKETFDEAVIIHNAIEKVYQELGYRIVNVPKIPVNKRVDFILSKT